MIVFKVWWHLFSSDFYSFQLFIIFHKTKKTICCYFWNFLLFCFIFIDIKRHHKTSILLLLNIMLKFTLFENDNIVREFTNQKYFVLL